MQWIAIIGAQKSISLYMVAAIFLKTHSFRPHSHVVAIIACTDAQIEFYIGF